MNSRANALDHRWGLRFPLARKVELVRSGEHSSRGVVENASISGAFIRTDARLEVLTTIRVRPYDTDLLLSALVIRLEPDGVGIEWMEPDPGLLETRDDMLRLTSRGVMLSNEIFQEFLT